MIDPPGTVEKNLRLGLSPAAALGLDPAWAWACLVPGPDCSGAVLELGPLGPGPGSSLGLACALVWAWTPRFFFLWVWRTSCYSDTAIYISIYIYIWAIYLEVLQLLEAFKN